MDWKPGGTMPAELPTGGTSTPSCWISGFRPNSLALFFGISGTCVLFAYYTIYIHLFFKLYSSWWYCRCLYCRSFLPNFVLRLDHWILDICCGLSGIGYTTQLRLNMDHFGNLWVKHYNSLKPYCPFPELSMFANCASAAPGTCVNHRKPNNQTTL